MKAAAGHASLLTTSVYLHVVVDEGEEVGELFGEPVTAMKCAIWPVPRTYDEQSDGAFRHCRCDRAIGT